MQERNSTIITVRTSCKDSWDHNQDCRMNRFVYNYHTNCMKDNYLLSQLSPYTLQSSKECNHTVNPHSLQLLAKEIELTRHHTTDELKSPNLTQQSLWKAGPAFTQRCWLNTHENLRSEVTPCIKNNRVITQFPLSANTTDELYVP